MKAKSLVALLIAGIFALSTPGATQQEEGATGEDPEAAPEIRRGFQWEPGFTYRPGFPTERRMEERTAEEFGLSPEFEDEAPPEALDPAAPQPPVEEELGVAPEFEDEPLEPWEEDLMTPHPDSRIDHADPLQPERTIQR